MAVMKLYGLRVSYYTGKMEAYLRYKEIRHEFVGLNMKLMKHLEKQTGAAQMPAIELPDGRFLTDTTPMIAWLEEEHPQSPVIPQDPVLRFFSFLLEDYFEEWLWRPAMHYRWSYKADRLHLGRKIVEEMLGDLPVPGPLKRLFIRRRQHLGYVKGDGVNAATWPHVESLYLNTLDRLETVFSNRPYLLGNSPSLGDFGLFAPMFRHFAQDPTASDIMRLRAPAVFAWQARLWNARAWSTPTDLLSSLPEDLTTTLEDISSGYLPYLNANARAWQAGSKRFDPVMQSVQYRSVPVSQYRVWCLEELQRRGRELSESAQRELKALPGAAECWEALFEIAQPGSKYEEGEHAPFRGRKVHDIG
ncbi:MAG: glutathione S-transferase family protein [Pseudomonadota bacterium]